MRNLIAETLESAKEKGIDLGNKKTICISLDLNGPLTATDSAALEPYPGIIEAINELDNLGVYIIINSAWDIFTLSIFNQKRLGGVADGFIGENGAVYSLRDAEPIIMVGTDTKGYALDLFINAINSCSIEGYSLAIQGNLVNACYYHEFETGLSQNICRQGVPRPTAQEFYEALRKKGLSVKTYDDGVEIAESRENYRQLQEFLSQDYKLVTIRPNISKGCISIQLDGYIDRIICLSDLDALAKKVIGNLGGWSNYKVNDDFCIDYFLSKNILKNDISKATALDALLTDLCNQLNIERDNLFIMGIGDGENDSCIGNNKNTMFFAISGTKSERNCDMKVSDGLEFLNIVKNIANIFKHRGQII
jgi:hypothetical protein